MIVEFSVKNFRSIKDLQTISFVATKLKSNQDKHPGVDENNIVEVGGMRLLKTVGIYGANASGKSNVIKALQYFLGFVTQSPQPNFNFPEIIDPFLFQEGYLDQETFFQIVLMIEEKKYRYGFTIKNNNDSDDLNNSKYKIASEWLFGLKEKNQRKYFTRNGLEINKETLPNGENIPDLQHEHNLFLSHAASYDKGVCYDVYRRIGWKSMSTSFGSSLSGYALRLIYRNEKDKLLSFLSAFNLNYIDIEVDENLDGLSIVQLNMVPNEKISLTKLDNNGNKIKFNLVKNESDGTRKLFSLAGFIIEIFGMLKGNTILIIDEIDSNFHPALLIKLIKIFNDPEINKAGAHSDPATPPHQKAPCTMVHHLVLELLKHGEKKIDGFTIA